MSESRLILVDGSGYIFRAYYALPPMNNSKGIPTNAVYGFCNMMLRLIEEHPTDTILIILDAGKNTFRNTLFPDYKANRGEAPEDLIPQFSIIREAIEAFGLDVIEKKILRPMTLSQVMLNMERIIKYPLLYLVLTKIFFNCYRRTIASWTQ